MVPGRLRLFAMRRETLHQLLRFACVGVLATAAHVGVAALLIDRMKAPSPLANALAVLVASVVSFYGHALWTFGHAPGVGNALRFVVTTSSAAVLAAAVAALTSAAGGSWPLGIAFTVIAVPVFTYCVHRSWTFRTAAGST